MQRDIELVNISGTSIFDIPDDQAMTSAMIKESDLFAISQRLLTCVQPDRTYTMVDGTVLHDERGTHKVSYEKLSITIIDDIKPKIRKFNSMAYELSDHYSLIDHVHNYSNVEVQPTEIQDSIEKQTIDLGKFTVNQNEYEIKMQRALYAEELPSIGELKFLGLSELPDIPTTDAYYSSSSFNGWVYADGRSLSRTNFSEAFSYFGVDYGSANNTTFRIPNFTQFFKPVSNLNNKDSSLTAVVPPRQQALSSHTHEFNGSTSLNVTKTYTIDNYKAGYADVSSNGMCARKGSTKDDPPISGHMFFDIKNPKVEGNLTLQQSDSQLNKETYPYHNRIAVLIYVGKYQKS